MHKSDGIGTKKGNLHRLYEDHEREMEKTRPERDTELGSLWHRVENYEDKHKNHHGGEKVEEQLSAIKNYLNQAAETKGSPIRFNSVDDKDREKIFNALRHDYKDGANKAEDFKVMYNVMRAFLVIKGANEVATSEDTEVKASKVEETSHALVYIILTVMGLSALMIFQLYRNDKRHVAEQERFEQLLADEEE